MTIEELINVLGAFPKDYMVVIQDITEQAAEDEILTPDYVAECCVFAFDSWHGQPVEKFTTSSDKYNAVLIGMTGHQINSPQITIKNGVAYHANTHGSGRTSPPTRPE